MNTTKKEDAIIAWLVKHQAKGHDQFFVGDLAQGIYFAKGASLEAPEHWRSALASTLRNLSSKVERRGCRMRRTSLLGRGRPAVYEFKGDFKKFIVAK